MMDQPAIIPGNTFQDKRGRLTFVNGFDMTPVKRFYTVYHPTASIVRAWQGHRLEKKWLIALEGAFEIKLVQPNDWNSPSEKLPVRTFFLSDKECEVLYIPGGFVNGFRNLHPASRLLIYSDFSLEESKNDDFRFDKNLWTTWD